jgi:hypothetical protein
MHECRTLFFKNIETKKIRREKVCRRVELTPTQRQWWLHATKDHEIALDDNVFENEDD